jgi:Terminase large subunit, T4likevirus-type, N-terminal
MAKWVQLPSEKLFYQKDQQEFLTAIKRRSCRKCHQEFLVQEPNYNVCPICNIKGDRLYDRLTIIAGRRWGKSKIGSIASVMEATIPNSIVWCCAPTNPKLHRYVIPAIQELIPEDWVESYSSEFQDLRLKNGSLIHFQTLEDPDQGRGQGLDALWIDEVCELSVKHWEVIRPSLAGDTVAFFTTSPRSYDWVYKELYKPAEDHIPGYWACHARTADSANPRISPEFLAREKSQMSETMYRQEYEADFVIFTGAIYGGAIDPQILRTDDDIRRVIPEWPEIAPWRQILVGIDTGADHPFGAVKLVSTEVGMVVVGEYLERHRSFVQHAGSIKFLANYHEGKATQPQVKYAINKNERQPTIELAQHGIYCQHAENDQVSGIERVKSWLQGKQLFFIEKYCPLTIKQMKAYRWAENTSPKDDQKRIEKVYKVDDELPDCIRYAMMTWPILPKVLVETEKKRDISQLPLKMQQDIQAMRKIEKVETIKPGDIVGDFWS